jgi:hypothetical protein
MKKLLFILAIVAVYGFSISGVNASVTQVEKAKVTIVADDNTPDGEKEKVKKAATTKEAGCTGKAEAKTGCSEKQKAACAEKGKACCGSKEAVPVPQKK